MKKINTLVVDDEIAALNTLCGMLGEYCPQIKVVATVRTVDEAVRAATMYAPELVFLDIEMPPFGSGFDFLSKAYPEGNIGVIFTTAHPQYAVRAINTIQPWAYLVKPFSVNELLEAVDVAAEKLHIPANQSIVIPDNRKGNQVLRIREILYCKADGVTTDIYLLRNGKIEKVIASRTLKDLEAELPESHFCRTHHSYLVNLQQIIRYERTGRNGRIYLPVDAEVAISVLKMELFEEKFGVFMSR